MINEITPNNHFIKQFRFVSQKDPTNTQMTWPKLDTEILVTQTYHVC